MNEIILVELVQFEGYGYSITYRKAFASEEKAEAYRQSISSELNDWSYIRTEKLIIEDWYLVLFSLLR